MRFLRRVVSVVDEVMHIEVAIELVRTGVGYATGMHHAHGRRQHLPIGQGYEEDEQNEHDLHTYRVPPANAIDQQAVCNAEYEDARSGARAREAAGNGTIAIKVVANDQLRAHPDHAQCGSTCDNCVICSLYGVRVGQWETYQVRCRRQSSWAD